MRERSLAAFHGEVGFARIFGLFVVVFQGVPHANVFAGWIELLRVLAPWPKFSGCSLPNRSEYKEQEKKKKKTNDVSGSGLRLGPVHRMLAIIKNTSNKIK